MTLEPIDESSAASGPSLDGVLGAERVLIVDDEPYIRDLIARCLEGEDYRCETVGSVDEAIEMQETTPFALLVSDINMPGRTGLDLLAHTQQHHADTAVIMVTAVDDRKTAIEALELGAYGYVIKPFDLNELVISVANAIQRRRLTLLSQATRERLEHEVRRRTHQIREREEEIALRLVAAAEFRDTETGAHIRRIGRYSATVAEALGWAAGKVDDLRVAATMHDVGKIGVPDGILFKPGRLTDDEFEVIKQHTTIGSRILANSGIPLLELAREIALSHHERWNGTGYPRATEGELIPPSARIVAVVDVYDALVHDRIYRAAIPEPRVLEMMAEERGQHFDPEVFDTFMTQLDEVREIRASIE